MTDKEILDRFIAGALLGQAFEAMFEIRRSLGVSGTVGSLDCPVHKAIRNSASMPQLETLYGYDGMVPWSIQSVVSGMIDVHAADARAHRRKGWV